MSVTMQIKAKVFAQYMEHKVRYIDNDYFFYGICNDIIYCKNINFHMELQECQLILKPLSKITDEDAFSVARICGVTKDLYIQNRWKDGKEIWITGKKDNDSLYLDTIAIRADGTIFGRSPLIQYYTITMIDRIILAYQFLQNKGYDLPNYLLGGKTLHQAGLAIYE